MTSYNVLAAQEEVLVQADEYDIDPETTLLHLYKAGSPGTDRKRVATFKEWTYIEKRAERNDQGHAAV